MRILYYHSISDDPVRSSVSPPVFERQIEHLVERGYRVLPLSEVAAAVASGRRLSDKSVVITLDDGFRDNYERAFPILVRARIPATIFLTVGYIGGDRLPTLTRTDFTPRPLSWDQVAEMRAHGLEFGSHTLTHPMLSRVPIDVARREITDSKRILEDKLGAAVSLFCYPRGDFNESVKRLVREDYLAACTTLPGVNDERTDPFALRRTYVSRQDSPAEFAKKVEGAYDLLQRGIALWRRIRRR